MSSYSRRRFLATVAGTSAVGLAGCNGLLGGGGGGGGGDFQADAEYVPASMAEDNDEFELVYIDIPTFRSEFPEDAQSELGLDQFEAQTGIAGDDLGGLLQIQTDVLTDHQVLTGSFGVSDILEQVEMDSGIDEYEGYEVLSGQLAVADGSLVISENYESLIDANAGTVQRLGESDDTWADAIERAADGAFSGVETASDEQWSRTSIAMNAGSDGGMKFTGAAYFESASAAASNRDAVAESITEGSEDLEDVTVESVSVEGSVVVVEAVAADYQF